MFFSREKEFSKEKELVEVSEENRIIFYIWQPKIKDEETTAKAVLKEVDTARKKGHWADINVGHVAMVTPNRYISLWPGEKSKGRFKVIDADYHTFEDDILSEGSDPDLLITLYSLNVDSIEASFDQVESSDDGYVLAGDKLTVRLKNERKGQSCCGIVHDMCQIGGVEQLGLIHNQSELSFAVTPDNLAKYLKSAKAKELVKHPETADYEKLEGEYEPKLKKQFSKV